MLLSPGAELCQEKVSTRVLGFGANCQYLLACAEGNVIVFESVIVESDINSDDKGEMFCFIHGVCFEYVVDSSLFLGS